MAEVALPPHRSNGATVPVHPGMATGPQTAMDVELEELGEASKAKAKAWHSVYDPQMDATLGRVPGESLFRETCGRAPATHLKHRRIKGRRKSVSYYGTLCSRQVYWSVLFAPL